MARKSQKIREQPIIVITAREDGTVAFTIAQVDGMDQAVYAELLTDLTAHVADSLNVSEDTMFGLVELYRHSPKRAKEYRDMH